LNGVSGDQDGEGEGSNGASTVLPARDFARSARYVAGRAFGRRELKEARRRASSRRGSPTLENEDRGRSGSFFIGRNDDDMKLGRRRFVVLHPKSHRTCDRSERAPRAEKSSFRLARVVTSSITRRTAGRSRDRAPVGAVQADARGPFSRRASPRTTRCRSHGKKTVRPNRREGNRFDRTGETDSIEHLHP